MPYITAQATESRYFKAKHSMCSVLGSVFL